MRGPSPTELLTYHTNQSGACKARRVRLRVCVCECNKYLGTVKWLEKGGNHDRDVVAPCYLLKVRAAGERLALHEGE
jgi:hypothetical protein